MAAGNVKEERDTIKIEESKMKFKAMIRIFYKHSPHPDLKAKREKSTNKNVHKSLCKQKQTTVMGLSIETPKNNYFSVCPK